MLHEDVDQEPVANVFHDVSELLSNIGGLEQLRFRVLYLLFEVFQTVDDILGI